MLPAAPALGRFPRHVPRVRSPSTPSHPARCWVWPPKLPRGISRAPSLTPHLAAACLSISSQRGTTVPGQAHYRLSELAEAGRDPFSSPPSPWRPLFAARVRMLGQITRFDTMPSARARAALGVCATRVNETSPCGILTNSPSSTAQRPGVQAGDGPENRPMPRAPAAPGKLSLPSLRRTSSPSFST